MPLFTARAGALRRHDGNAALPVCLKASGRVAVFSTGQFGLTAARVHSAPHHPQNARCFSHRAAHPTEFASAAFSRPSRLNAAVRVASTTAGQDAGQWCSPGSCPLRPQRGADRGAGPIRNGGKRRRSGCVATGTACFVFTTTAGQDAGQWCSPGSCPLRPQRGADRGAGSCSGGRQMAVCQFPRAPRASGCSTPCPSRSEIHV
jgi:hypothetical protein